MNCLFVTLPTALCGSGSGKAVLFCSFLVPFMRTHVQMCACQICIRVGVVRLLCFCVWKASCWGLCML